ncbi:anti-sigma factor family protein [Streptomyces griseosporeus]|uniref:anti-sigma factor family protein n=1 Tax=Streptomyces griseosporeus TaxID=1910 RepID=UPI00167DDA31|nr:membrane protein [Streptomyces griseosporeus]
MSGSRPDPAEQHLGDRLSALVDGELGHDARERVLAHVATCPKCKAEVDAQRRLKNVFAEVAPPPPSESFLARLQGLPAGGDPEGGGTPLGGGGIGGSRLGGPGFGGPAPSGPTAFGMRRRGGAAAFDFDYTPLNPAASGDRGFRIHPVGRGEGDRPASRGLRFAFVAAGAVSLAALALGGMTGGTPADTDARGTGSSVLPARPQGTGAAAAAETQRRRVGPLLAQTGQGRVLGRTPAPTEVSAPLLPGVPAPAVDQDVVHTLTTPVMAGAAAMSPLIRPLEVTAPIPLAAWSGTPALTTPGVSSAPTSPSSP